ncbi:MAG: VCBS repeat-containing protein, partial [Planctomycetota bacterium]|nr:VCBS repeat-containing protein [Planctomycetota bacterium]
MRSILPAALILLFVPAAPPPPVPTRREVSLQTEGPLDSKMLADFDGDGRLDIFIASRRRYILFLQRPAGFRPKPDQIGPFPPGSVLYDSGDVTGDGAADVVILTRAGFSYLSLRKGKFPPRPISLVEDPSVFQGPTPSVMWDRDFLRDLDGDGLEDLILPIPSGIRIYRANAGGEFRSSEELLIPHGAAAMAGRDRLGTEVVSSFWLSDLHPGDYTGDGRPDLGLIREGALWVFAAGEDGGLPRQATRRIPIRKPRVSEKRSAQGKRGGLFRVDFQLPLSIEDINGDKFPDFITSHVGQGSTHIFLGSPSREEMRTPSQILKVPGFSIFNSIQDLDGDGRGDLIVASVPKIGLWSALKIFISRSVTAQAHVYYNRGSRLFPLVPDYRREIDVPIIARKGKRMGFGTRLIVSATGDFDGDGIKDLVLRTGDDRIGVFRGLRKAGFAEKPYEEILIRSEEGDPHQVVAPTTKDL